MRFSDRLAAVLFLAAACSAHAAKPPVLWKQESPGYGPAGTASSEALFTLYYRDSCRVLTRFALDTGKSDSVTRCASSGSTRTAFVVADGTGNPVAGAIDTVDGSSTARITRHDGRTLATIWDLSVPGRTLLGLAAYPNGDVMAVLGVQTTFSLVRLAAASGATVWELPMGSWTNLPHVATDASGNAFVSFGIDYGVARIVKKIGANGSIAWSQSFSSSPADVTFPEAIAVDGAGNLIASGGLSSASDPFNRDFAVAKLAGADGTVLWRSAIPAPAGNDSAVAVSAAADGGVVATGVSDRQFTTARFSADGALQWKSTLVDKASTSKDTGALVVALADGGAIAAGTVGSDVYEEVRVIAYAADGSEKWRVPFIQNPPAGNGGNAPFTLALGGGGVVFQATNTVAKLGLEPRARNFQGLWWRSPAGSASGWGMNLAQQGETIFGAWFTYDTDKTPAWYFMPSMVNTSLDRYEGSVYRNTGPSFASVPFDSTKVKTLSYGYAVLDFGPEGNGVFTPQGTNPPPPQPITRYVYGADSTCGPGMRTLGARNYQDLWWADPPGAESGWGVFVVQQSDSLFLTWFTYAADGSATWYSASGMTRTADRTYQGTLAETSGATLFSDPWPGVQARAVGPVSLTFDDAEHATFRYAVDGVQGTKRIVRYAFAAPATLCQ